ncbi:hypothetical protein DL767_006205 [Monosporascus sp. MG133]|nr:hypothetical protein DL767_006205 [Monosporascus sp. MG133]
MQLNSKTTSSLPLVAAALLGKYRLASAQPGASSSAFGSDNYGDSSYGPWGLDNAVMTTFLERPNATGTYPLSGPETTSPASESGPVDGWAWDIRVRADIPISETNVTNYHQDLLSQYFTGSQIRLKSPSSEGIDPSWLVCVIRWQVDDDYSEELRQDDGTCSSVLDESCRSDMADVVANTWADRSGTDRCRCPDLSSISSCGEPPAAFDQGCSATVYNATHINNSTGTGPGSWSAGEYLVLTYGGAAGARGDTTLYDQTGSLAWPFMVVWGRRSLHAVPTSQLTCVRAANATDGSQAPGADGTGGDGGSGGSLNDQKSPIVILVSIFAAIWMTLV